MIVFAPRRWAVGSAMSLAILMASCGDANPTATRTDLPASSKASDVRSSYLAASKRYEDGLSAAKAKFVSHSKGLADFESARLFYRDVGSVYSQFAIDVGLLGGDTPAVGDHRDILMKAALQVAIQLDKMSLWTIDDFAKFANQDDLGPLLDTFRSSVADYSSDLGLRTSRPVVPPPVK